MESYIFHHILKQKVEDQSIIYLPNLSYNFFTMKICIVLFKYIYVLDCLFVKIRYLKVNFGSVSVCPTFPAFNSPDYITLYYIIYMNER